MDQWVPFAEGEYVIEHAFMLTPDGSGVAVENAVIEVFADPKGIRQVKGKGMTRPALMVSLHEDNEVIDMVIDLGSGFRYYLKEPSLQAGKVFSPEVMAFIHFFPSGPWEPLSQADYDALINRVKMLE
jgi:hypothetical protein